MVYVLKTLLLSVFLANSSSILCCLAGVISLGKNWLILLWVAVGEVLLARMGMAVDVTAAVVLVWDTPGSVDGELACPLSSNCTVGWTVLVCLCRFVVEPALIVTFVLQWRHSALLFPISLNCSQMLLRFLVSLIVKLHDNARRTHAPQSSPLCLSLHLQWSQVVCLPRPLSVYTSLILTWMPHAGRHAGQS